MVQVKKTSVRDAILESAFRLFSEKGYAGSTLAQIAENAGVSTANVYVYYGSKLDIVFAIYGPWLQKRLERLERDVARIADPRARVRRIVRTLWRDIPAENGGFAKNLMQALASATADDGYEPTVLKAGKTKIAGMIKAALSDAGRAPVNGAALAHIMFMAFDGFALNVRLNAASRCSDTMVEAFCDLLLPHDTAAHAPQSPQRRAQTRSPSTSVL